ncbi:ABC-type Fe3+-siderophore transport system, permease 2 component [Actinokineospora spheciospongiae]|uniref:ABC-type Fe3+-siderophore transport system, permease 2 component n=1 Tax=Actinokineospora spheciospongiae TaxID=909613 RepID=W7IMS6_9PSEU|nr:iron chelate uptake ABC transporter family permease subunit [Actinokineospora spheciospongiae]EWC62180.1 ABC-type Fe3+-siderophore transport system, permease 2 component [Actinokineospora spheciospongiae]
MITLARVDGQTTFRVGDRGPSGVLRARPFWVAVVLAVLVFLCFCLGLTFGDYPVTAVDAMRALFWYGDPTTVDIVYDLRLPRVLVGLLVGSAFGLAGAVFQTLARNALASPDVIGVAEGANTAAVAGIVFGFGASLGTSTTALLGALASATAIYLLAWRRGTTGYRIVLVGIGVSALFTSLTSYLLQRADVFQAQRAVLWLTGSLNLREWKHVGPLAGAVLVLVPVVLLMSRWLSGLMLGDDTARGLGVPVQKARLALMLAGVGLVAFATAAAGPVAFVSLVSPQIGLRLARRPTPPLVVSALTGALVVLAGDLLARPFGLPVGVVTGAIGAPYLLWLLSRAKRLGSGA